MYKVAISKGNKERAHHLSLQVLKKSLLSQEGVTSFFIYIYFIYTFNSMNLMKRCSFL